MRYVEAQRRGKRGHVVVTFVDDGLRRRTVAVPFRRSAGDDVQDVVQVVNDHAVLRPPTLET